MINVNKKNTHCAACHKLLCDGFDLFVNPLLFGNRILCKDCWQFTESITKIDITITDNQIINEWLFALCDHEWSTGFEGEVRVCRKCKIFSDYPTGIYNQPINWDAELYQQIEDEELWSEFATNLKELTIGCRIASLTSRHAFKLIKATLVQKEQALSRAIKEVNGN